MREEWIEDILERLSREQKRSVEEVRREMEDYVFSLARGEVEGTAMEKKILRELEGESPSLEQFLERLTQETLWEKDKERELAAYLETGESFGG